VSRQKSRGTLENALDIPLHVSSKVQGVAFVNCIFKGDRQLQARGYVRGGELDEEWGYQPPASTHTL